MRIFIMWSGSGSQQIAEATLLVRENAGMRRPKISWPIGPASISFELMPQLKGPSADRSQRKIRQARSST